MSLHCLYAAPDSDAAERLRGQLSPNDCVLLLGSAVRLAAPEHPLLSSWLTLGIPLYALEDDLAAYGVSAAHAGVSTVDYAGWVSLSEAQPNQCVWR